MTPPGKAGPQGCVTPRTRGDVARRRGRPVSAPGRCRALPSKTIAPWVVS